MTPLAPPRLGAGIALLAALGCTDKGDDSGAALEPPDITGHYQSFVTEVTGCGGEKDDWMDWATGPLSVDGDASLLTFDFGDDLSFTGSVNSGYQFAFSGLITYEDATLDLYGSGSVTSQASASGGAQWVLDGGYSAEFDDDEFETNNCTLEGRFEATQLTGA